MNYSSYKTEDFLTDDSFIDYCLGENPESMQLWESAMVQHPELTDKIALAKKMFFLLAITVDPVEKEAELLKLKSAIADTPSLDLVSRKSVFIKKLAWISVAAMLIIGISLYALLTRKNYQTDVPAFSEQRINAAISTGYNERKSVTLPDGSVILMNSLTSVKLDDRYGEHNRVLWLNGEAHFSVAKNKDKPFIVIAGKTAITALGTSFKINNYKGLKATSVMLTTGKVDVGLVLGQKILNKIRLLPGQKVDVATNSLEFKRSSFDLQEIADWSDRKLVFEMASLTKIKAVLKDIYGVEITAKNQPKRPIAFTGEFHNERLTEVLDAIGFSNHFTYQLKEDTVTLNFEK